VAVNSRRKGTVGERLACHAIREATGFSAKRTQQYRGTTDSSDVEVAEMPELFVEVKREERLQVHKAMAKAVADAATKLPLILHRKNNTEWLVTVRLTDLRRLADVVEKGSHLLAVAPPSLPAQDAGGGA
jgi:hypothetical protein